LLTIIESYQVATTVNQVLAKNKSNHLSCSVATCESIGTPYFKQTCQSPVLLWVYQDIDT